MADLRGFDAREVEPMDDFEPVPAGSYVAIIVGSELKATKAGDGQYLELELEIADGAYKGRKLWDRLCLKHSNPLAVKIARAQLAGICKAVQVVTPSDSHELHDVPLQVKVGMKRREDTGELANEVKSYATKHSPAQASPDASGPAPWTRS